MRTPKNIVKYYCLDLGNVVVETRFDDFLACLAKHTNSPSNEQAWNFLIKIQKEQDLGMIDMFQALKEETHNLSSTAIQEIIVEWDKILYMNDEMKSFILSILDPKIKNVCLTSNMGSNHGAIMRRVLTEEVYDRCIPFFSYEVGARKPQYLYYKTLLDMYPQFKGATYLDDRLENVEMGNKFGLNSIEFALDRFSSPDELRLKLKQIKEA